MPHERKVFTETQCSPGAEIQLSPEESHYVKNVLRLTPGSHITVAQRHSGAEFDAIVAVAGAPVILGIVAMRETARLRGRTRCLAAALLKGEKNDIICENGTALGVEHLIFWSAERSIPKTEKAGDWEKRMRRWERIAEAAARQAGLSTIPRIHSAASLEAALEVLTSICESGDRHLTCSISATAPEMRHISPVSTRANFCIGPEGDFTPAEIERLACAHFEAVSLGPFRLRSELAASTAVSMANALWGYA